MRSGVKYKNQSLLQHIAQTDIKVVLLNPVFAYAQPEAKTQSVWWMRWQRCLWQNAENIWATQV